MSTPENIERPHLQLFAQRGIDNRIEPQIDEIRSMKTVSFDLTKNTIDTLYTVPTGKKFVVKTIIIFNDEASATTYILYDAITATNQKTIPLSVGADVHAVWTKIVGLTFETAIGHVSSQFTNGSRLTFGGYLIDA